jgi:hypothetical protein
MIASCPSLEKPVSLLLLEAEFMGRQTQTTLSQRTETESILEFFPNQSTGQVESSEDNSDLARYLDADISWAG